MSDQIIEVEASIDADGHITAPVALDLGPAVEGSLTAGLVGQSPDSSDEPPDLLPPPGEASQAQLAETLSAAERRQPKRKRKQEKAEAQPEAELFFVGLWKGQRPIYGCPGCAIRGHRPEDIMWHLRSFPAHAR